jgi:cysteine desulfurase
VMLANNEIGAIQPIAEFARVCKQRGVLFHCDATQAVGRIPVDVQDLQVDLMSFSAHKLYGPKGVGALYVRRRAPIVRLEPRQFGGSQERGLRSGTLNSPGIVGFGRAMEIAIAEMGETRDRLSRMRNRLYDGLVAAIPDVLLNGPTLADPAVRLAGNLNMAFSYVQGEALLLEIKDLAVSSGSACTSANPEPSHVLRALGLDDDLTRASLRFGLGRFNTETEVDFAIEAVSGAVARLRKLSSLA